jgi:hypothetical protein
MNDEPVNNDENPVKGLTDRVVALNDYVIDTNKRISNISDNAQEQLDRLSSRIWKVEEYSDNRFWLSLWQTVAIAICFMILVIGTCAIVEKNEVSEMVANGANPIAARCAYYSHEDTAVCLTYINSVTK